jgi:hypothetical protein
MRKRTSTLTAVVVAIAQTLTMRSGLANYTATYELTKTLDDDP